MEIIEFGNGSNRHLGSYEDLIRENWFINLKKIYEHLKVNKYCHVRLLKGDYKGSIAKFTIDKWFITERPFCQQIGDDSYNLPYYYFSGKLSWTGKRNNPSYKLFYTDCTVLLDYTGDGIFRKFNRKKEEERLLQEMTILDINGVKLSVGDKVVYLNARYGCGARLSVGVVESFKPNVRGSSGGEKGSVSIIVTNKRGKGNNEVSGMENSECKYPHKQIYKV